MALFEAALDAARAEHCVPRHLPEAPAGRTVVVGAGKAVAAMAKAVEDHWVRARASWSRATGTAS